MRRTALLAVLIAATACASGGEGTETTPPTPEPDPAFPVTVIDDVGPVTIEARPTSVVSLSPSATEALFAMGAGEQVVAVDDQSDFPSDAPMTELSGYTPNVEAVLSYQPDLVVLAFDPPDSPVVEALESAGVPTLTLGPAQVLDDVYRQIGVLGEATGNSGAADELNEEIRTGLERVTEEAAGAGDGLTYYHELDPSLYTATSRTFIGELYGMLGLENVADEADPDGTGYPQLSSEFVVSVDPDLIFLADAGFGESAETLSERPGWAGLSAIESGAVTELDEDIASRWGPRVVDFLETIADAVERVPAG